MPISTSAGPQRFLDGGGGITPSSPNVVFNVITKTLKAQQEQIAELTRAAEESGITARSTVTPVQVNTDVNDYDPGPVDAARLSTDASRTFTGFSGGRGGRYVTLFNVGSFNIVIGHQNAGSSAANRVISYTGADLTLAPSESCQLWYDAADSRWRIIGH